MLLPPLLVCSSGQVSATGSILAQPFLKAAGTAPAKPQTPSFSELPPCLFD